MLVSDIYDDAVSVLGRCNQDVVFRRLTEAVRMLARKARWDSTLADIDVCVCDNAVTLPADCKTILGVAVNGQPAYLQDSWFSFHLNGPGVQDWSPVPYTQVKGTFCTFRDPSTPVYVVAQIDSAADNNKQVRVFGYKQDGTPVYTANPTTGVLEPGQLIPTIYGYPVPATNAPLFARITRIDKQVTSGFVKLIGVNPSDLSAQTLLGHYLPGETEPAYQRLTVGPQSWVRVRYQKKDDTIRSQNDWININDPQALMMALKAVRFRYEDKNEDADQFEVTASRLLSEEQKSLQPNSVLTPQIINSDSFQYDQDNPGMFYGGNNWGGICH